MYSIALPNKIIFQRNVRNERCAYNTFDKSALFLLCISVYE